MWRKSSASAAACTSPAPSTAPRTTTLPPTSLVLPTRSDPWGIPVIEAMAAGLPVVTTEAAGSASVAAARRRRPPRPGPLARRGWPSAIGELLGDPARRREMGERGKAEAVRFDVSSVVDATLAVYERALAEKSA